MSNPLYITLKESTHGVNSGGHPDVSNRPCRTIWSNFTAQHNKDGTHFSGLTTGAGVMEQGTYTGTGAALTVTLTNTALSIEFIRVFSAATAFTWWTTAEISLALTGVSISTQGVSGTNQIVAVTTGSFDLGTSTEVNDTGITYYYIVYGVEVA